jgi:hypothetical protein
VDFRAAHTNNHKENDNVEIIKIEDEMKVTGTLCTMLSSVLLALDNPHDYPNNEDSVMMGWCNQGFTIILVLEMLAKMLATGLVCQQCREERSGALT